MANADDLRLLNRAKSLGLISEADASACQQEVEQGAAQRVAQVLLRRRLLNADIIMALMQQVRDLATTTQGVVGSQTWTQLTSVSDIIPPVRAGDDFAGCTLMREIARGGIGILYEAKRAPDGETVAIKVLSPEAATSPPVVQRFNEEARLATRLDHPHLVKVLRGGTERGIHYMVMDYFEGRSLADLIRPGRLAPKKALEVMACVADACAYMHAQNVIHRDIKPANIMVGRNETVCLTDFGIAKDVARFDSKLTQIGFGKLLGTPAYMSPEQARGELEAVGPHSDVYAIGAVLYRAIGGRYPFAKGSYMATVQAIGSEEAPSLAELRPDAPPALLELIASAMQQDPRERPTAAQLAERIRQVLEAGILMPPGPPSDEV